MDGTSASALVVKRTPLRRTAGPRRHTRLAPRSAKRQAITAERAEFVADILGQRRYCQATLAGCTSHTVDVHEIVSRGRGGPIVPSQGLRPGDVLALCRACHDWITTHPAEAAERGWLSASWERPAHLAPTTRERP